MTWLCSEGHRDLERSSILVPWLSKPWSVYNVSSWKWRNNWTCLHAGGQFYFAPFVMFIQPFYRTAWLIFCWCYYCYVPTDVCPNNFSPCTWFLDVTIHNNNGRWQPYGMCESELHFYFFSLIMNEPGHIFANLPPSLRSVRDPWVVLGVVQMQPLHINL